MKRRGFLKLVGLLGVSGCLPERISGDSVKRAAGPNIILCMTDDQGWGDVGYNGHATLKTPNLDKMSKSGLRFDRFYAAAPVCSPTRGSAITGRHPYRYGIYGANTGHMRPEEVTLAEVVREQGYRTGHFGKWHLGTMTTTMKDSNRGRAGKSEHYSPPQDNGFDVCFTTESKVPTWDPMKKGSGSSKHYGTHYFNEKGEVVTDNLEGDDSRVIMDRAIPFIQKAAKDEIPFLAIIWFHTPHKPVIAGDEYLAMYEGHPGAHYLGCLTAMDEQMGRLRGELRKLDVADNTMLFFCSDNGPEDSKDTEANGTAGHFRGRKRSLYEGGVRVPGLLEWPAKIKKNRITEIPCGTIDYFPTVIDVLGLDMKGKPEPIDGVSLLPLIEGTMKKRPRPIGFQARNQLALSDNRYKIYSSNSGKSFELYDLIEDPSEANDIAAEKPEILKEMTQTLQEWQQSCKDSDEGKDYK